MKEGKQLKTGDSETDRVDDRAQLIRRDAKVKDCNGGDDEESKQGLRVQASDVKVRAREAKAIDKQKCFQANLFGNFFFKHLQKAKSSLDEDREKVSTL